MSSNSNIEWTEATWNPVSGCTRASPGCDNCYAVTQSYRLEKMGQRKYAGLTVLNDKGDRHFNGVVRTHDDALTMPMSWREPRRVFVNSMSDLFHRDVPFEFIDRVFAVMALCPQHAFQILTKRPERMAEYLDSTDHRGYVTVARVRLLSSEINPSASRRSDYQWPMSNVWLGTSVEDQQRADKRIPQLLKCEAAARFLSCEPLLGQIDLRSLPRPGLSTTFDAMLDHTLDGRESASVSWVIVGGESGGVARPCDVAWIRFIVSQCKAAGVAVFVKQLGAHVIDHGTTSATHFEPEECWPEGTRTDGHRVKLNDRKGGDVSEWPEDLRVRQMPETEGIPV